LRQQLSRINAELEEDQQQLEDDIMKILRKPANPRSAAWRSMAAVQKEERVGGDNDDLFGVRGEGIEEQQQEQDVPPLYSEYLSRSRDHSAQHEPEAENAAAAPAALATISRSQRGSTVSSITRPTAELPEGDQMDDEIEMGLGVEARNRFQKARIKVLTKQVEQSAIIQKKLQDQVDNLQQSLREEREESKKLRKKVQLLETTSKRQSKKAADEGNITSTLQEDLLSARRDLATAERLAKQNDQQLKAKEAQLKRALETIDRLKSQVSQLQSQTTQLNQGQQAQTAELQEKVRKLERQKAELVNVLR
jgi:hypothetical protein